MKHLLGRRRFLQGPDVYNVLKGKNIHNLYHANTVTTSCTFLKLGGLASRGYVTDIGLPQTSQYTDSIDKKYGIWYDVFTDTVDIHYRAGRFKFNQYGPVLFVLDLAILKTLPQRSEVFVTKKNPTKWIDGEPIDKRFFTTQEELESSLEVGTFDQMVVIRTRKGILPFPEGTIQIILDDPQRTLSDGTSAFLHATTRIKTAALGNTHIHLTKRICRGDCRCLELYKTFRDFDKFFQ